MTNQELWQALLAQIQFNVSQANFITWFKDTGVVGKNREEIVISVPNNFCKEWLKNKYHKIIFKILHSLDSRIKKIKYEVKQPKLQKVKTKVVIDQLEFQECRVSKESNLNPRYLFENFVVGSFNELAYAAAQAVSKNLGVTYNPLFIYGGVGLGKTHLIQAIGNKISKKLPKKKIKYLPAAKFTSEIVNAIQGQTIEKLKADYQKIDVLIIDDIQFIAGKEKTQEEFFHVFNVLYDENKQIILSSDRPPSAIYALEERLCSRFEGGMIADISLPNLETRMAILKAKTQEAEINVDAQILEYIATNIKRNIRELEGALNQIIVYNRVNNNHLNLEKVQVLLKNITAPSTKRITPQDIMQTVTKFYHLPKDALCQASRKKEVVRPRQIAMYLMKEELKESFPCIGRKFGGRDHTTALYGCRKITKEMQNDSKTKEEVEFIKQAVYKS